MQKCQTRNFNLRVIPLLQRKRPYMKTLFWDNTEIVQQLTKVLSEDKVILADGDTVLGLLANISVNSYAKLDHIKKRSQKPYLLLVRNKEKALSFIEKDDEKTIQIEKLINFCWPGPVTIIFKAKANVPQGVKSMEGNIAIRVPNHAGLLQLLDHFDALYSTSANTSGKPVPSCLPEVEESIIDSVEEIVLNKNSSKSSIPSTIIDCTGKKIKVIREGAFPVQKLSDFL